MSTFETLQEMLSFNFSVSQFSIEYNNVSDDCQNAEPTLLLEIISLCQPRLF